MKNIRALTWNDAGRWIVAGMLMFCAGRALGQDGITIKGDVGTIKVEKRIVTYEERTLVKSLPFELEAPKGGASYVWDTPTGLRLGRIIKVDACPKGEVTFVVTHAWINKGDLDEKRFSIAFVVGEPGPDPKPDPKPDPTPDAAPYPSPGLTAMIVFESAQNTPSLRDVTEGNKTNDFMIAKGIKGGFLKLDQNANDMGGVDALSPWAKAAWQAWVVKGRPIPCLLISNGKTGYVGDVPKVGGLYSPAATLELLKKHEVK